MSTTIRLQSSPIKVEQQKTQGDIKCSDQLSNLPPPPILAWEGGEIAQ